MFLNKNKGVNTIHPLDITEGCLLITEKATWVAVWIWLTEAQPHHPNTGKVCTHGFTKASQSLFPSPLRLPKILAMRQKKLLLAIGSLCPMQLSNTTIQ